MGKQRTEKLTGKRFKGLSSFEHGRKAGMGVLVVNLGTPDEPTTSSVRRYLAEFLSDRRVIEIPKLLWMLILHGIILRIRPAKSARAYKTVWSEQGSPLMAGSADLSSKILSLLNDRIPGKCNVQLAMRYGNPSIKDGLEKLHAQGAERIMVLPLYPQYSGATTGSVADAVFSNLSKWRWVPELRMLGAYHDDADYILAVAQSIYTHWQVNGNLTDKKLDKGHKLFISFHGMPKATLNAGDPYFCHCHKTARLIATELNLNEDQWEMAFQSRFGKAEWLQPYAAKRFVELPEEGVKNITVVCPGFSIDCLETLEEIAIEGREEFIAAGGQSFEYITALNSSAQHVDFMVNRIVENASAWPELKKDLDINNKKTELTKQLALAAGGI
ncbi:MAG: ferrochelatase [Gammaproteobacteria bacterium]|nr:ferrochelatase [Gammaproteobacteria bacterium]